MQSKTEETISWVNEYDKRTLRILNAEFLKEVVAETGDLYNGLSFLQSLKPEHRRLLLSLEIARLDNKTNSNNDYRNKLHKRFNELYDMSDKN